MNIVIPVWFFILCLLIGALGSTFFAWSIRSAVSGGDKSGRIGNAAVMIESFLALVRSVFAIVTSSQQGRVLAINTKGNVVVEFINKQPGNSEFDFVISHAICLPPDFLNFEGDMACKS